MIEHKKRYLRTGTILRGLVCFVLGLWFFSFSCLMARAATVTISSNGGVSRPPDYYLLGIDKIIVWANAPLDPEIEDAENQPGHPHIIPRVDFVALNRSIVEQMRIALSENKHKIQVEHIIDSPLNSGAPNKDENALILHLTFGYHIAQLGDRRLILGAVYPSVERLPPVELRQDRVSGFHRLSFIYVPVPFLMDGDESAITATISQATQKCVGNFAKWFAYMPSQIPAHSKDPH